MLKRDVHFQIRIMLSKTGVISCTSIPLTDAQSWSLLPVSLSPPSSDISNKWLVYLQLRPIEPSLVTRHKTTERLVYDLARRSLGTSGQAEEVLLQNGKGEVTEGSVSTPYFWRDGRWITPVEQCGGNLGTTRRWALEKGLAVEGIIKMDDVKLGEVLVLSNGVRGFNFGIIKGHI